MAKGIHLEADSTTQEFKLYHGRDGLYIGRAVLKNNVFVLDFVPDLGTADSDAIVNFTDWTHPPDLDPNFTLFCDNQSAIRIANKSGFANRTKHIALRYFFVKDEIEKGKLELSYCPTSEMAADYLTKKLGKQKFKYCMLLTGQGHVTISDTPEAKGSVGNNKS
ncbi:unnamed protein product [Closterium sp. NIES-53]